MINLIELMIYIIIFTVIIAILGIVFFSVKHYFKLKEDTKALEISKSAQSKAYQLEKKLKELEEKKTIGTDRSIDINSIGDIQNMTLEQAAEFIGIDPKELNNPLVRPLAEKFLSNIKERMKQGNNPEGGDIGY